MKAQRCMAREARALEEAPVLEQEDLPMGALFIVQYGADGGTAMRCTWVVVASKGGGRSYVRWHTGTMRLNRRTDPPP